MLSAAKRFSRFLVGGLSGFSRLFRHCDKRCCQRRLRPLGIPNSASVRKGINPHVVHAFNIRRLIRRPKPITPHDLQVVRYTSTGHHVRQPGRDRRVTRCIGVGIAFRFLSCLTSDKSPVVGVLEVDQREKAKITEFLLSLVRQIYLYWANLLEITLFG